MRKSHSRVTVKDLHSCLQKPINTFKNSSSWVSSLQKATSVCNYFRQYSLPVIYE